MAWEQVGSPDYPPTHDFETAPVVEGIYEGKKENVGKNKKNIYLLRLDDGNQVGVWGSAVLDALMEEITPLDSVKIRITFTGTKETKRGQNPAKIFTVEKWSD